MTKPTLPAPRPLCAAFAPLLPLISSGALEDDEASPTREHVAECAWCRQELARYVEVDQALRRGFGAMRENSLLFPFDLDGDDDDYAFILEESMMNGEQDDKPTVTRLSPRWNVRRRVLSPRATAIAGIAAALILAVVATTIYTQFAARRTTSPAATTTTKSAFSKVIKLPNSAAAIGGLTITSDGSLWFTEYADLRSKIGRLSADGTLTEFPVPSPDRAIHSGVGDMTLGPDGTLWFEKTDGFAGQTYLTSIIRMTPDGAMTTFPLPSNVSALRLLFGPDGALWFSEGSTLGRLATDGHLSGYPVPTPLQNDQIVSLCIGPDGALWYTWFRSNHIGRMTLDGTGQDFTAPYIGGRIIKGPDGALWFTELLPIDQRDQYAYGRKGFIGRITTSGVYTEMPINPNLVVSDIIAGPDGAIWFSAFDPADSTLKLGRLSASGDVTLYSTNEYGTAGALAAAPGTIWMLEGGSNTLWRYRLPA
jgi:virginiamycin B lyase